MALVGRQHRQIAILEENPLRMFYTRYDRPAQDGAENFVTRSMVGGVTGTRLTMIVDD